MTTVTRDALAARDEADPLAPLRARFALPDGVLYFDGNSLGPPPITTAPRVETLVRAEWGGSLIGGWLGHGWMERPATLGAKVARLVGADADEVLVVDTISVNLFKLLAAALDLRPGRTTILSDRENFPTDLYIVQGLAGLVGDRCRLKLVAEDEIEGAIDDDTALVTLTEVNYRSGRRHDMAALTAAAHDKGALMLWDLAHSAGALPIDLHRPFGLDGSRGEAAPDFAVGCGYKYLNGGPGAPGFLYVARHWQNRIRPVLAGWLGHEAPFEFVTDYRPAPGLRRLTCSTPSVMAVAALECGVDVFLEADMAAIREKSLSLSSLFIDLVERDCAGHGFTLASPRDPARRGSQVSLAHDEGYAVMQALIGRGVIGDFRAPNLLRFGFTPLYQRFVDVWDAVAILREIMDQGAWDRPDLKQRAAVT